ncbi:MAG: serine/threonine protein kinase [Actinomycetota bacterium]|nr:serine/threonine protein kinase [Actinomycetota bacterium]
MAGEPRVGEEFAGYRIDSVLGRGGMSVVYLAEDLGLKRKVALKILAPELSEDAAFRDRFIQESQIAANLDHPNIVPIFEARETDGVLYMAMRLVRGKDLRTILRAEGALSHARATTLIVQVAGALDAAHAAGLVHRDVKPANILVVPPPDPASTEHAYLSDFGVTKRLESQARLTATGQLVGTADYVAPEQIEGRPVDGRADVYSLGCVLFECLTGRTPFRGDVEVATLWAHVQGKPPQVTDVRPDLPPALNRVLGKALAKTPDLRYRTAGEFAAAARAAVGSGSDERPLAPQPGGPSPRRRALLGGGIALVVVVGLLVFLLSGRGTKPRAGPSTGSPASVHSPSSAPVTTAPPANLVTGTGLFRLDPQTGMPSGRIAPSVLDPGAIDGLAVGEGGLWVHVGVEGQVAEIKPKTKAVAAIVPADRDGYVFTEQGSVWIGSGDGVLRVDPVDGRIVATIPFPVHPIGTPSSGTTDLLWADGPALSKKPGIPNSGRSIVGIDTRTNKVVVDIALPSWSGMCMLGGSLWVAEPVGPNLGPRLLRLDPATGHVLGTVGDLPIEPQEVTCGAGRIWLLDDGLSLVAYEPSGHSASPAGIVAVPGEREAGFESTTSFVVAGNEVLVVQGLSRTLWVVDPALNAVVATVQFHDLPVALGSDGRSAWLVVR